MGLSFHPDSFSSIGVSEEIQVTISIISPWHIAPVARLPLNLRFLVFDLYVGFYHAATVDILHFGQSPAMVLLFHSETPSRYELYERRDDVQWRIP